MLCIILWNNVDSNIIIADCDPNEHVNAILEYGASETVPDWTVNCKKRGYVIHNLNIKGFTQSGLVDIEGNSNL